MPALRRLPRNIHSHEHGAGAAPHWLLLYPAYSILPLVRSPLGYEIVRPLPALFSCLFVAFLPYVLWFVWGGITGQSLPPDWGGQGCLLALMALSFIAGTVTFAKRMRDQRTGVEIHTAEAGYSALARRTDLPIPLSEIIIMPALIGGAGWLLFSPPLFDISVWLMLCGASYLRMSFWEHARKWAQVRAVTDDMTRAQVFEERLNDHAAKAGAFARARPTSRAGGGNTDEPDVAEMGAKRRHADPDADLYSPAQPPGAASWHGQDGNLMPDIMTWFRPRRPGA